MTAQIIDGKAFAANLRQELKHKIAKSGLQIGLTVILVGDDPASHVYVKNKDKAATEVGITANTIKLPATISQPELVQQIEQLNNDTTVHGILVQLPLPKHIDEDAIINAISPDKDCDGFHIANAGKNFVGQQAVVPCTPLGSLMLLKDRLGNLSGLNALVIGRSNIVGKPMANLLLNESCTVTIAHSRTKNLEQLCKQADIVVSAVGRPNMVKGGWLKPGCTVIDVGINRIEVDGKYKLTGDVDFESASKAAANITPVPGGVGPMTIACLLHNCYELAKNG